MTLNLDRTERKTFVTYLTNQLCECNVTIDFHAALDALVSKFGERYSFDAGDLNSEIEGIVNDAIEAAHDAKWFDDDPDCTRYSNDDDDSTGDYMGAI